LPPTTAAIGLRLGEQAPGRRFFERDDLRARPRGRRRAVAPAMSCAVD
jgi:hypothetical protein